MKRKRIAIGCLLVCLLLVFGLSACASSGGEYSITVEGDYGRIVSRERADAGEKITVRSAKDGYSVARAYVDGEAIEGDCFIMPARDVTLTYALVADGEGAHTITLISKEEGALACDLLSANAGEEVILRNVPSYNSELLCYVVNGEAIEGDRFSMPDCDVTVEGVFASPIAEGGLIVEAVSAYQTARSHWYASYGDSGFTVRAVVEDNIVYNVDEYLSSIAYGDNVEFILGRNGDKGGYGKYNRRVLVSAKGEYWFQKYEGGAWVSASATGVKVQSILCDLDTHGFVGYEAEVFIPYSALSLTRGEAYGNLTVAPALRNTLSALTTNWVSYSGMNCSWENVGTHPVVSGDGTFVKNTAPTEYLFAGADLLAADAWSDFGADTEALGDSISIARRGSTLTYWTENVDLLMERGANEVIFCCSYDDVAEQGVIGAFSALRSLIEKFGEGAPDMTLRILSVLPTLSDSCDVREAEAFNSMVQAYASAREKVEYIDVYGQFCPNGVRNMCLYSAPSKLSFEGYRVVRRAILAAYGKYTEIGNGEWGDCGQFVAQGDWQFGSELTLKSGGTSLLYSRTVQEGDFTFEAEITVDALYNNDAYPKFGLLLANSQTSRFFYVCAENNLTCNDVGIVTKAENDFEWSGSKEYPVNGLRYTDGQFVAMKIVRQGNSVELYANGAKITSLSADVFKGEPLVLGIFSFNLGLTARNVRIEAGGAV